MWLRIDADMPWHDKIIALPNDTARFAFVKLLCAAKVRGRSAFSSSSLREIMGSHARAIPALLAVGLLEHEGDLIVVHDFDDYQRRAAHAEAQERHRERHQNVTEASPTNHQSVTPISPTYIHTGQDIQDTPKPPLKEDPPAAFMGFRQRGGRRLTQADLLADIKRQHDEAFEITKQVAQGQVAQGKPLPKKGEPA